MMIISFTRRQGDDPGFLKLRKKFHYQGQGGMSWFYFKTDLCQNIKNMVEDIRTKSLAMLDGGI